MNPLRMGDRGADVLELQRSLNADGASLDEDGIFGPLTRSGVRGYQERHGLPVTGVADVAMLKQLWGVEEDMGNTLSPKALQLILDYEVGGGEAYYNRFLSKPTWPEGSSGVTIGIGSDLGYESLDRWIGRIPQPWIDRLQTARKVTGLAAKRMIPKFTDIFIPWDVALDVFLNYTVASEIAKTRGAFPGYDNLPHDVQGVLVSLVFNRGTAMNGDSRKEMRQVRDAVARGDLQSIADAIRRMKRLWAGTNQTGLLKRRDAEAALVESVIKK